MKQSVVVAQGDTAARIEAADPASAWKLLFAVGVGLGAIGFFDLALMFYGAQPSSLQWEYGTVLEFVQGQNVLVLGIGAISAASVANGWLMARRVVSLAAFVMALLVTLAGVMMVLDVPAMLKVISDPAGRATVTAAGIRTSLFSVTYLALYLALGLWTWRRRKTS